MGTKIKFQIATNNILEIKLNSNFVWDKNVILMLNNFIILDFVIVTILFL